MDMKGGKPMLIAMQDIVKTRQQGAGYSLHVRHLALEKGAKVAIAGPSGCGKSTLLDLLGMVLSPDSGKVFRFSPEGSHADILKLWAAGRRDAMARLRLEHIGYVLQTGGLLPFLSVADNMALTCRMNGIAENELAKRVASLAESLDISHLLSALPASLSIGERQRAAIGRALAPHPDLILADEPTAALDPLHAERVLQEFIHAADRLHSTLVMVTHDTALAQRSGLRIIHFSLTQGQNGSVRAILDDRTQPSKDQQLSRLPQEKTKRQQEEPGGNA